ncbi:MAG: hypothetical protein ACRERE_01095 [Candidatus Entotheonellia bacterium]
MLSGKGQLWQLPEGRSTYQKAAVREMSKCHEIIPGDQYKMIPDMLSVVDHLEHVDVTTLQKQTFAACAQAMLRILDHCPVEQ